MLSRIKGLFVREKGLPQARLKELRLLPPAERLAALAITLHDLCVKEAARFVEEEHRRADSPFRDLAKADLFHEMLVMDFWVFEALFKGRREQLMERLFQHYNTSFVWGLESGQKELMESMRAKFRIYDRSWDDHTGHQDVFARQAIGVIFGEKGCAAPAQASFWLISHADRVMKEFAAVVVSVDKLLRDAG